MGLGVKVVPDAERSEHEASPTRRRADVEALRGPRCRQAGRRGLVFSGFLDCFVSMILPQVHLRKPCYDFSFLEMFRFKQLGASRSEACATSQAPSENFIGTFIGRSDGRCVQRAGTYSVHVDDIYLLGIPSLHVKISKRESS